MINNTIRTTVKRIKNHFRVLDICINNTENKDFDGYIATFIVAKTFSSMSNDTATTGTTRTLFLILLL